MNNVVLVCFPIYLFLKTTPFIHVFSFNSVILFGPSLKNEWKVLHLLVSRTPPCKLYSSPGFIAECVVSAELVGGVTISFKFHLKKFKGCSSLNASETNMDAAVLTLHFLCRYFFGPVLKWEIRDFIHLWCMFLVSFLISQITPDHKGFAVKSHLLFKLNVLLFVV